MATGTDALLIHDFCHVVSFGHLGYFQVEIMFKILLLYLFWIHHPCFGATPGDLSAVTA